MKKTSRLGLVILIVFSLVILPFYGSLANVAYADKILGDETDNDDLYGTEENDVIKGFEGDDDLYGCEGDDILRGGADDDALYGGDGEDDLYGGAGEDDFKGGPGDDDLYGGPGSDYMEGGPGEDDIFGNGGDDDLWGGPDNDLLDGGRGPDYLKGGPGDDEIYGGNGNDSEEYDGGLYGGPGDDELYGENGDDDLFGGPGSDILDGGSGDDYTRLQGEIDDYSIVISGDSENTTLTFEQVDSSDNETPPPDRSTLAAVEEEDSIVDTVTNVEYIEFCDGDEEDDLIDVTFVPLDGSAGNATRNYNGSYTVNWGYTNNNDFTAYEDDHYFEDNSGVMLDPENKEFEVGSHNNEFETTSGWLVQKWKLGDKFIVFDASELESQFLLERHSDRSYIDVSLLNSLFEEHEKSDHPARTSILWLAIKGLVTDFETLVENIDNGITVDEAVTVLNNYLEYDITENLELDYEEDDVLTKEIMALLFTTAFELDEKEITELDLQVTEENKALEITTSQFYITLADCIF